MLGALVTRFALAACSLLAGCLATTPETIDRSGGGERGAVRAQAQTETRTSFERCMQPLGTVVLAEPVAATEAAKQQALASMPALRKMVADSGCFVVVDRSRLHALQQQRELQGSGTGRAGSNFGAGQMLGADFTLRPQVMLRAPPPGNASSGLTGALVGRIGRLSGSVGDQYADAGADLVLVDNRSGVQLTAAEGTASGAPARAAAPSAPGANPQVVAALADSLNQTVRALREQREADPAATARASLPVRHVNLDAPRAARPTQPLAVQVWLSQIKQTPEARVDPPPAQPLRPDGQLLLDLPTDRARWNIEVALTAPGFDFVDDGPNQATVTLAGQDSSPARFRIVAREGESGRRTLRATLWHEGTYLGSVSREVEIRPSRPAAEVSAPASARSLTSRGAGGVVELADATVANEAAGSRPLPEILPSAPDLTVWLEHEDPRRLDRVHVVLSSPHMNGLVTQRWTFPADADEWLVSWMDRLQRVPRAGGAAANIAMLRGLGSELYERLAPPTLRRVLADLGPAVTSIQIFSNNPAVPWELMRPGRVGPRDLDFLGTTLRLARWHASGDGRVRERPPQRLDVREVVVVAPEYTGGEQLPAQRDEVAFLSQLRGYRPAPGTFAGMQGIAQSPPRGIVHFAGHGEMTGASAAQRRYHLRLTDGRLDTVAWRGLPRPAKPVPSLYFFNACELGAVESQAGAVAGWAPAVLDGGAGGYIGGLWPLQDGPASAFAKHFYADLNAERGRAQRIAVADALRRARRLFYDTGDPTYLAYVFYGDVNLELTLP